MARVRRCPLRKFAEIAGFTLVELLVVVAILALIIAFIQKRPSGLFALKGRSVET